MAIAIFTVTSTKVHDSYFSQLRDFSADSKPKSTTIADVISEEAADLAAALGSKGISAAAIDAAAGTYPNAYAWCQKTLKLATAVRVFPMISGQAPELLKTWKAELKDRFEALEEHGFSVLGDAPTPEQSGVQRSWVQQNGLDTNSSDDMSSVLSKHRMDDQL